MKFGKYGFFYFYFILLYGLFGSGLSVLRLKVFDFSLFGTGFEEWSAYTGETKAEEKNIISKVVCYLAKNTLTFISTLYFSSFCVDFYFFHSYFIKQCQVALPH